MDQEPHLDRVIGVPGVAFTAFNCIVGMGIFGVPGLVAGLLGNAALLAYFLCLLVVAMVGLCFAEAGSRVQGSGGVYAYASAAFGPVVGGVAGALIVSANCIVSAAALVRFVLDVLAATWPIFAIPFAGYGLITAIYLALVVVNTRSTADGARLTIAISFIKLAPLALLAVAGLIVIKPSAWSIPPVPPIAAIGQGTLLLFFAFMGVESGTYLSGETRDPARTVPRAIMLALCLVAVLYISLQTVTERALGAALANSPAPLVDTARVVFGPWGAGLLTAATILSISGYIVTDMLCSPRVVFALAECGQLPRKLAWVHPIYRTPTVAIVLYPVAILLVASSGTFREIAILSTAGSLVLYLIVCLSVLRLRAKRVAQAGTPFVVPGGSLVPLGAAAIILWLLSTLSWSEMVATGTFITVIGFIYYLQHWSGKARASADVLDID
jgi:amino acid transporter